MGAVDTTYTFTATDTITSSKMNNIIDQTTITTDAIIGTTLDVASGKLKIRSAGITSNEMGTASVTQAALAPNVAGNGPAFFAWLTANQACPNDQITRVVQFGAEIFDTNACFNTSTYRFVPNVAGYYQINLSVNIDDQGVGDFGDLYFAIRKNGTIPHNIGIMRVGLNAAEFQMSGSVLIYMNGTTDFIEGTALNAFGTTSSAILISGASRTFMSGFLARSA